MKKNESRKETIVTPKIETQYQMRNDLDEIFADHVEKFLYDNNTLRLEFCVQRLNTPTANTQTAGVRVPACRLVLTPKATLDLYNKLSNMVGVLEKRGALSRRGTKVN